MSYTSLPTVTTNQPVKASWGNLVDSNLDDHQSRIAALEGASASSLDGLTDVAIASPLADQVLAYSGSSWVNTAPIVRRAVVSLTDAQVKALPTTPITLLAAPGAGLTIIPNKVLVLSKVASGAYTNVDADGYMVVSLDTDEWSTYLANDAGNSKTHLTEFLSSTNHRAVFREWSDTTDPAADWGPMVAPGARGDNAALKLSINNNGTGNLTGGNAANALRVVIDYHIESAP